MPTDSAAVAPPSRLARAGYHVGRAIGWVDVHTARIPPWAVLPPLAVAGWLVAVGVASKAVHTGWLYHLGGDERWTYTTGWLLAHGLIPVAPGGYLYSLLLAPVAAAAGPSLLSGVRAAIVLNVALLGTIALFTIYALAKAIAGRRYAYLVTAAWVAAPLIVIPYFLLDYHRRYFGFQLPADLGLTTATAYPAMVAVTLSAYFAFRAISTGEELDGLTAGLAAGLAIAVKTGNAAFLPAPVLALAVARRPRALLMFGAGLVPALVCLGLWKLRGNGEIFSSGHFVHFSWHHFQHNLDGFREFTWSRRITEWAVVAGVIGIARRSIPGAVLIAGWLASYMFFKGGSGADFYGGTFFRSMAPAFPAAFLLVMALPLLVPILGGRLARYGTVRTWPQTQRSRRWVLGVCTFLAVAPLVPILAFSRQHGANAAVTLDGAALVPVGTFGLAATVHDGTVTLAWKRQGAGGARVAYGVIRSRADVACAHAGGAARCYLPPVHAKTWVPQYTDTPPAGRWTYRVVVLSGTPPPASEPVEVSSPVTVKTRVTAPPHRSVTRAARAAARGSCSGRRASRSPSSSAAGR